MVYTLPFFNLQNAICLIILTYLIPVLFTFYIQGVPKLKKNNSGAKRLTYWNPLGLSSPVVGLLYPFFIRDGPVTSYWPFHILAKLHSEGHVDGISKLGCLNLSDASREQTSCKSCTSH
jgi:hypothetical protein